MLTSAISWLFAACTSFFYTILPTPPLLSWAVAGGCRLDLAALKYVLVTPFCGRLAVAALSTTLVLAACSPATPPQQVTLRIGLLRIQDDLPYFVMQEQGFAKLQGLQLVETLYQSGAAIIEALVAGAVDVGADVGTVPVFSAAERGLVPGTVIAVGANYFIDPQHPSIAILAAPAISSWKDLKGLSLAVNGKNSLSAVAMKGRLLQEGIQDYTLVEISFANMGLAVAGGNIAAAVMSEPWLTQSRLRGDGTLLDWIIGGPPFEHIEGAMILFRTDFHRQSPQAIKAFLRAHIEAVAWINRHPDEARAVLAKRLQLSHEVARQVQLPRWALDARNDPDLLERMQPLLVELGLLKAPISARHLYDETLLQEVLAEKR
jgi:NitT/TauT family transport system substrate-binding protein